MRDKINHVQYTKTYTAGQLVLPLGCFFHRLSAELLRNLFTQFIHQLSFLDSVDFTEWYIDGTKMEANRPRGHETDIWANLRIYVNSYAPQ